MAFSVAQIMYDVIVCSPLVKWLLRHVCYGCGSIERLLSSRPFDERMFRDFCTAVASSRQLAHTNVKRALIGGVCESIVATTLLEFIAVKRIRTDLPSFRSLVLPNLQHCIEFLDVTSHVIASADILASTPVDMSVVLHRDALRDIWTRLQPGRVLPDCSGAVAANGGWPNLGFQGHNPATDFRATGVLGLAFFAHFAKVHAGLATAILARANRPIEGYPLALASIHATAFAQRLLRERRFVGFPLPRTTHRSQPIVNEQSLACDALPPGYNCKDLPPLLVMKMRTCLPVEICHTVQDGILQLAATSATLLLLLDDAWAAGRPSSVMDFRRIF